MPLGKNSDAGDYVKDFAKSNAPQFKGKSKEKRRKMAIAAYLDNKEESTMKTFFDIREQLNEAAEIVTEREDTASNVAKALKKMGVKYDRKKENDIISKIPKVLDSMRLSPGAKRMLLRDRDFISDVLDSLGEALDPKKQAELDRAKAAFFAKGRKITKAKEPVKAPGYHGLDDVGKDMHGILPQSDTKRLPRGKKVKSMGSKALQKNSTNEGYGGTSFSMKAMSKMKPQEKEKPPFNNPKPINKDPKDKFGNPIKNRARHLARAAARSLLNNSKNEGYVSHAQRKAVWATKADGGKGYKK